MSITKILANTKAEPQELLYSVADIVAAARKAYDNEDTVIEPPMVNTVHGTMSFKHLEDNSKLEILRNEVQFIKAQAIEASEQRPGVNINKKIEELLATNPLFVNISSGTKFEYI